MQGEKKTTAGYANLMGRDGIVTSVSLDQSFRGARYEFERAYAQYHELRSRAGRGAHIRDSVGLDRTHFYRFCQRVGVPVHRAAG